MNFATPWTWNGHELIVEVTGNRVEIRKLGGHAIAVGTMCNGHLNNCTDVTWPLDPSDWHWQASADQAIRDAALRAVWP